MTEPVIPMSEEAAKEEAARLIASAYQPTTFRDDTPTPAVGTTPPVAQPGRPPMSQKAVDISTMMITAGVASVPVGGSVSLVLYTLGNVDPTALAIGATAPVALVLAIGGLLRSLRGIHTEHHHHYNGTVIQDQRETHTKNTGLIARTNNRQ